MTTTRTHVILPAQILREIDALVGQRGRSALLAEVALQEVRRRKLLALLDWNEPVWKDQDPPELKHGAAAWISKMRRSEQELRDKDCTQTTRSPAVPELGAARCADSRRGAGTWTRNLHRQSQTLSMPELKFLQEA